MEMLCYKNTILRGVGGNLVSMFISFGGSVEVGLYLVVVEWQWVVDTLELIWL